MRDSRPPRVCRGPGATLGFEEFDIFPHRKSTICGVDRDIIKVLKLRIPKRDHKSVQEHPELRLTAFPEPQMRLRSVTSIATSSDDKQ